MHRFSIVLCCRLFYSFAHLLRTVSLLQVQPELGRIQQQSEQRNNEELDLQMGGQHLEEELQFDLQHGGQQHQLQHCLLELPLLLAARNYSCVIVKCVSLGEIVIRLSICAVIHFGKASITRATRKAG